jgi:predicted transcriptional regulator
MKRTTIFLDEALERDLEALAARQRTTKAAVVRTALERHVRHEKKTLELGLRFVGLGRSGRSDIAERHEELLWQEGAGGQEVQPARPKAPGRRTPRKTTR